MIGSSCGACELARTDCERSTLLLCPCLGERSRRPATAGEEELIVARDLRFHADRPVIKEFAAIAAAVAVDERKEEFARLRSAFHARGLMAGQ